MFDILTMQIFSWIFLTNKNLNWRSLYRSSHRRCSVRKVFLEIWQNSQENTCTRISLFNKVAGLRFATLLEKRLWHRCFPGFYEISKNTFFTEHILATVSGYSVKFYCYSHFFKRRVFLCNKMKFVRTW